MQHFVFPFFLAALLGVTGCGTLSVNPQLVGTYVGVNAESLDFLPDARVYYDRAVEGQQRRVLLGYAVSVSSCPSNSLSIIGPDISPYLGTCFQASDDFRTIRVHWRNLRDSKDAPGQTLFSKKTGKLADE